MRTEARLELFPSLALANRHKVGNELARLIHTLIDLVSVSLLRARVCVAPFCDAFRPYLVGVGVGGVWVQLGHLPRTSWRCGMQATGEADEQVGFGAGGGEGVRTRLAV